MKEAISSALVLAILGAWWVGLRPASLGGPVGYVLVRGVSMLPTHRTGDLVLTRKQSAYTTGDIVAYLVPRGEFGAGAVVIHRIVGGNGEDGFVMKGDNNSFTDDWHPRTGDVVGREWVHVPKFGMWLATLRAPLPLAAATAGFVIAFILMAPSKKRNSEIERIEPDIER